MTNWIFYKSVWYGDSQNSSNWQFSNHIWFAMGHILTSSCLKEATTGRQPAVKVITIVNIWWKLMWKNATFMHNIKCYKSAYIVCLGMLMIPEHMEKGPHTNICNVLASFHEVMKLQRFFWKWHYTHEYTKRFFTGFLCILLLILCRKILHCQKPLWCFWPFFTNLWSYEILNDKTVSRGKWRHPCEWTYIIC